LWARRIYLTWVSLFIFGAGGLFSSFGIIGFFNLPISWTLYLIVIFGSILVTIFLLLVRKFSGERCRYCHKPLTDFSMGQYNVPGKYHYFCQQKRLNKSSRLKIKNPFSKFNENRKVEKRRKRSKKEEKQEIKKRIQKSLLSRKKHEDKQKKKNELKKYQDPTKNIKPYHCRECNKEIIQGKKDFLIINNIIYHKRCLNTSTIENGSRPRIKKRSNKKLQSDIQRESINKKLPYNNPRSFIDESHIPKKEDPSWGKKPSSQLSENNSKIKKPNKNKHTLTKKGESNWDSKKQRWVTEEKEVKSEDVLPKGKVDTKSIPVQTEKKSNQDMLEKFKKDPEVFRNIKKRTE